MQQSTTKDSQVRPEKNGNEETPTGATARTPIGAEEQLEPNDPPDMATSRKPAFDDKPLPLLPEPDPAVSGDDLENQNGEEHPSWACPFYKFDSRACDIESSEEFRFENLPAVLRHIEEKHMEPVECKSCGDVHEVATPCRNLKNGMGFSSCEDIEFSYPGISQDQVEEIRLLVAQHQQQLERSKDQGNISTGNNTGGIAAAEEKLWYQISRVLFPPTGEYRSYIASPFLHILSRDQIGNVSETMEELKRLYELHDWELLERFIIDVGYKLSMELRAQEREKEQATGAPSDQSAPEASK